MKVNTGINFTVTVVLTEQEVRALDAMAGYGFEPFIKQFYSGLGKHYMQPYEAGIKSLFDKVQALQPNLYDIDQARKVLATHLK